MNKLKLIAMMVACAFVSPLAAAGKGEVLTVLASVSCVEWLKGREEEKVVEPFKLNMQSLTNKFWLLGFVSGLNSGVGGPNLLGAVDGPLLFDWMDRYCAKNPKSDLYDGGNSLLVEVLRKRRK